MPESHVKQNGNRLINNKMGSDLCLPSDIGARTENKESWLFTFAFT